MRRGNWRPSSTSGRAFGLGRGGAEPEAGGESETGKEGKEEAEGRREGGGGVAAPWRRSRSRRGMERRRLLGGMALLLLQALPSPLSVRAEPPQVRGGRLGQPGGPGWSRPGWRGGLKEGCLQRVECCREERPCLAWTGRRGLWCLAEGHL